MLPWPARVRTGAASFGAAHGASDVPVRGGERKLARANCESEGLEQINFSANSNIQSLRNPGEHSSPAQTRTSGATRALPVYALEYKQLIEQDVP